MTDPRYYISLDVGGTHCRIALMESDDNTLKILSLKKFPIGREFNLGILELATHIKDMSKGKKLEGIGGSFPGLIDSDKGMILSSANLPEWQHKPIKEKLEEYLGVQTCIFHDVSAAVAGEVLYGHGLGVNSLVFLIWGTGFGGAKSEKLQGKLHISPFEPGHYVAERNGKICICGQRGCPEIDIGGGSLSKKIGKSLNEVSDEDPLWEKVVEVASQTVANVQAFHPTPLIVFG